MPAIENGPPAQLFIAIVIAIGLITLMGVHFPKVFETFPPSWPWRTSWLYFLRFLAFLSFFALSISATANLALALFDLYELPINDELLWKWSLRLLLAPVTLLVPWSFAFPFIAVAKNLPQEYRQLEQTPGMDDGLTIQLGAERSGNSPPDEPPPVEPPPVEPSPGEPSSVEPSPVQPPPVEPPSIGGEPQ